MRAQALTCEITIDRVDLEALDKVLRSDRLPPNGMMVSELDGFLTGIAIGPELIRPSEWLPLVWGGNTPEFAGLDEANAVLCSLMVRYNEILRDVADDAFAPIFWTDRKGTVVATDWAEGFLQAIKLRPDAWKPLFTSERDGKLLFPILSLCCDERGASLLGLPPDAEDRIVERAPELITSCVIGIAAYWRHNGPMQILMSSKPGPRPKPRRIAIKVGRNDPCPCGSGRKYKRCCAQAVPPAVPSMARCR